MGLLTYFALGLLIAGPSLKGAHTACCPTEWLPFQGCCYRLFAKEATWADAVIACQNLFPGCHLASIHSSQESAALAKYTGKYNPRKTNVWIGLRDAWKNRQWRWIDNSPVNYLNWNPGEPNNANSQEDCVDLWASSGYTKWNDENCVRRFPYLCKFRL